MNNNNFNNCDDTSTNSFYNQSTSSPSPSPPFVNYQLQQPNLPNYQIDYSRYNNNIPSLTAIHRSRSTNSLQQPNNLHHHQQQQQSWNIANQLLTISQEIDRTDNLDHSSSSSSSCPSSSSSPPLQKSNIIYSRPINNDLLLEQYDTTSSPVPSPPQSPRQRSLNNNQQQDSLANDYEYLKESWKRARDLSQEIIKVTKQACKSDFTLVDHFPGLIKEYENLGNLINSMSDKVEILKTDERQKKKRKESDRNAEKRKKRREATLLLNNVCKSCFTTDTPEWRKGPDGTKSLCNACGLHYAKNIKREGLNQPQPHITHSKESMKVLSILN